MRHARKERKLSRSTAHRRAMLRNLVTSLFMHERVTTSVAKAKEGRRYAERMITFAKRGDLHARRQVARFVNDPEAVQKLFAIIAPWYSERNGGYTRILKTGPRLGDAGQMAIFELVKTKEQRDAERHAKAAEAEGAKKSKRRLPSFGRRKKAAGEAEPEATAAAAAAAESAEAPEAGKPAKKKGAVKKKAVGTKKKAGGAAKKSAARAPAKKAAKKKAAKKK
jgi:large subunit ribosomal protein L17